MQASIFASFRFRHFVGGDWPDGVWIAAGLFIAIAGALTVLLPLMLIPAAQDVWQATYPVRGAGIVIGSWLVLIGWCELFDAVVRMRGRSSV
jgi:hypothetical protein